jgi:DNA repair photolyase
MKPIYIPKGKAKEYGDYAINIYTGCPHRCYYCFAPSVLRRDREAFHSCVEPRSGIVEAVKRQLETEQITDKLIHLCFTCDPYPTGHDSTATREIIKLLKDSGNHVQILTKGDGSRDFDLLDQNDWYGITLDATITREHDYDVAPRFRYIFLKKAHDTGIKTWVSFEPVLNAENALKQIIDVAAFADKVKIGKLNYHPSDINWAEFGRKVEEICKERGIDYYIKDSLRAEMEEHNA